MSSARLIKIVKKTFASLRYSAAKSNIRLPLPPFCADPTGTKSELSAMVSKRYIKEVTNM